MTGEPEATAPHCGLILNEAKCTGRVYVVQMPTPSEDGASRTGYSVCDTCQARYDVTVYEDGRRPSVLITTGRARGAPDEEKLMYLFPGEDAE